jgi:transcriptional regulator with XRE-family HTH domain
MGDDFNAAAFGQRIATLREQRRMSLQEVGQAAGFTKSHVWELETGRTRNPTVRAVWALARALGTSPAYMLGLSPETTLLDPVAMDIACQVDRALRSRSTPTESQIHAD